MQKHHYFLSLGVLLAFTAIAVPFLSSAQSLIDPIVVVINDLNKSTPDAARLVQINLGMTPSVYYRCVSTSKTFPILGATVKITVVDETSKDNKIYLDSAIIGYIKSVAKTPIRYGYVETAKFRLKAGTNPCGTGTTPPSAPTPTPLPVPPTPSPVPTPAPGTKTCDPGFILVNNECRPMIVLPGGSTSPAPTTPTPAPGGTTQPQTPTNTTTTNPTTPVTQTQPSTGTTGDFPPTITPSPSPSTSPSMVVAPQPEETQPGYCKYFTRERDGQLRKVNLTAVSKEKLVKAMKLMYDQKTFAWPENNVCDADYVKGDFAMQLLAAVSGIGCGSATEFRGITGCRVNLRNRGVIGTSVTTGKLLTRLEFYDYLLRAREIPLDGTDIKLDEMCTDVPPELAASSDAASVFFTALKHNIVSIYGGGACRLDKNFYRHDAAKFALRALDAEVEE